MVCSIWNFWFHVNTCYVTVKLPWYIVFTSYTDVEFGTYQEGIWREVKFNF